MLSKVLTISIVFVVCAHIAQACSDYYCEPHWALNQGGYSNCSSLPILAPSNDTRVNFKLLLVDGGFATLREIPVTEDDAGNSYGKVPFSVDHFESNVFSSKDTKKDADAESGDHGYGEGSRCASNESGKADFIAALNGSKELSTTERQVLIQERQKLNPDCVDVATSGKSVNFSIPNKNAKHLISQASKQFLQYLAAATAFYEGRYDAAKADFSGLANSKQPWLRESSRYMLGRTELNRAQQDAFDSYGFPDLAKVDRKALAAAEGEINGYLQEYPNGRYASTARGLLRRVYWMSDKPEKLADEYSWQLNNQGSPQNNLTLDDLALEVDNKLFAVADPKHIKNPLLLATLDLSLMRPADSSGARQISFSDLSKQKTIFAGHPDLYEYLLAAHRFYVQKDAAGALKALSGKIPQKMTYLDFSRLVLRGLALEATKDRLGARKLWLGLLPASLLPLQSETVQLALALNYEYGNEVESVFKPDSPITEPAIRNILIRSDASPELLRRIINSNLNSSDERRLATFTLLYKNLLQGHYKDYIRDYRFLPGDAAKFTSGADNGDSPPLALFGWAGRKTNDSYGCPSTLEIAKLLAANPNDPYGLVCLGDFVKTNGLDSDYTFSGYSGRQSSDTGQAVLGSVPSEFPGTIFSRGEAYKTIIADTDPAPDLKAYALYRSIECYAHSGNNQCGGSDVEQIVRKSWFQTLKKRYPNSVWAKSLKYYW